MELSQLETFLAVAEERSFSRAAVRMHRTQPAVSQVIRKLEAAVGETLFDRAARDGSLTPGGEPATRLCAAAAGAQAGGSQCAG
jgi:DNA-binding transcriptional LysR family regulator